MKRKGILYVVSAPSGTGKTTLLKRLFEEVPDLNFSVSYTTRPKRTGEEHGKDYFFVSKEEFAALLQKNEFIEYATVHDNLYGTSLRYIEDQLTLGNDIVLDIDTQGALQLKSKIDAIFIFITPPSFSVLEQRLKGRQTDADAVIEKRLLNAKAEMSCIKKYDYVVVNDKIDQAVNELQAIVVAERCRVSNNCLDNWSEK